MPVGFSLIGATSDHLIVGAPGVSLPIGAEIAFQPNYSALMRIMAAPHVEKVVEAYAHNAAGHAQTVHGRA